MNKENKEINPIICPKCLSNNLFFVTEYHKCVWLRLLINVLFVLLFLSIINDILFIQQNINNINIKNTLINISTISLLFLFLILIIKSIINYIESKTHIQAICKDCGHIWFLN